MVGHHRLTFSLVIALLALGVAAPVSAQSRGLSSADLYQLKSVGDVQTLARRQDASPTGRAVDRPGTPSAGLAPGPGDRAVDALGRWRGSLRCRAGRRMGDGLPSSAAPSGGGPDDRPHADGADAPFIAEVSGTNHPLPSSGDRVAWSPDGAQLAFVSATPGPETEDANGDPMVITRYLYKPTASEGLTRFNDNRRLHIFVADVASRARHAAHRRELLRALASTGRRRATRFSSSPTASPIPIASSTTTSSPSTSPTAPCAASPTRRAPSTARSGRPTASTIAYQRHEAPAHLVGDDDGGHARVGDGRRRQRTVARWATLDNRQGAPRWSRDGQACSTSPCRSAAASRLYRVLPRAAARPERLVADARHASARGRWRADGTLAYAFTTPARPAELYVRARPPAGAAHVTDAQRERARWRTRDRRGRGVHVHELRRPRRSKRS